METSTDCNSRQQRESERRRGPSGDRRGGQCGAALLWQPACVTLCRASSESRFAVAIISRPLLASGHQGPFVPVLDVDLLCSACCVTDRRNSLITPAVERRLYGKTAHHYATRDKCASVDVEMILRQCAIHFTQHCSCLAALIDVHIEHAAARCRCTALHIPLQAAQLEVLLCDRRAEYGAVCGGSAANCAV